MIIISPTLINTITINCSGGIPINQVNWEAYVGEYASGKSEVAVNRAISLLETGQVTIVDLDLVEPFYTLRPIKKQLIDMGLEVVAWETSETFGLGEAGSTIKPEMRWVLRRPGNIILDVGYGVDGAKTLNLVEDAFGNDNLKIFAVINIGRPMTSTVEDIVEYVNNLGIIHGLVNNSHLGDETYLEFIQEGARVVTEAADKLKLPVIATYINRQLEPEMQKNSDCMGNPVKFLDRYMINAFW